MQTTKKPSAIIFVNLVLTIVLFLTIEGLSSVAIFTRQTFFGDLLQERKHSQYDEELGWINLPGLNIEDMYGPGKSFRTNSMTFRSNRELSPVIPAGKVRVVCSGDSFTMGYGVDTDAGWCQQLESIDSHIESVNLGQGGYGVDQAYLWYKRNSGKLEHNILLFAFITLDFLRMQSDTFFGYGKPLLKVENGVLVNKNRPVPRLSYTIPRLPLIREGVGNLSVVKILRAILLRVTPSQKQGSPEALQKEEDSRTREVVLKIFEDLQKTNQAKNSVMVLVYLPWRSDYPNGKESGPWRQFAQDLSLEHRFLIIDLVDEIAKLPPQEAVGIYSDNGHYSEKGNLIIAHLLYKRLLALPEIESQFQKK